MKRRIVQIDEEKCNGCGLCAKACHENAISMINGKAHLLRDDYCDGLGDCLPACPMDAISFIEREALPYDEVAVKKNQAKLKAQNENNGNESELRMWPVQIKLAPISAPYFNGTSLLIAADCTAYAYGNFHKDFIKGRTCLIACPKLDMVDYSEKLADIFASNDIKDITLTRMVVPCCGGLEHAVKKAIDDSGKEIPLKVVTIKTDGSILT